MGISLDEQMVSGRWIYLKIRIGGGSQCVEGVPLDKPPSMHPSAFEWILLLE